MTKILFVCHGSISKSSAKACNIKGLRGWNAPYYTTTTPFGDEP